MRTIGIILIVLGAIALAYQGISYTTKEKVLDLGSIEVEQKEKHTIPLPPILGGLALATGIILTIAGSSGKQRHHPSL